MLFNEFISNELIPYLIKSPTLLAGIIAALIIYFGYFYSEYRLIRPGEENLKNIFGLFFIFGYLSTSLFVLFLMTRYFNFRIENSLILTIIKVFTVLYSVCIIYFSGIKIVRYRNSFVYTEADYILNFLNIKNIDELTLPDIISKVFESLKGLPRLKKSMDFDLYSFIYLE